LERERQRRAANRVGFLPRREIVGEKVGAVRGSFVTRFYIGLAVDRVLQAEKTPLIQNKNSRADLATALLDFYALAGGNVNVRAAPSLHARVYAGNEWRRGAD